MKISLWGKVITKNRITAHHTVACAQHSMDEYAAAITAVCRELDIPNPVVLKKHEKDLTEFNMTRFLPDDFMESVKFQRLEIEVITERGDKKQKLG